MTPEFLLTSLIVVLLPGTGVIYTVVLGLSGRARGGLLAAFGCTLGILPHLFASIVGLAALLHSSALAFQTVKYLGVAYLLYMAYGILRERGQLALSERPVPASGAKIVTDGFLLNILNPKLSLFFLAFLPQFVPAQSPSPTLDMVLLALVFMAMTFVVFVGYGLAAAQVRSLVVGRPSVMRVLRYSFAGAFGLLGARLALAER